MYLPSCNVGLERCRRRRNGDVEESIESSEDKRREVEYESPIKRELEHLCESSEFGKSQKSACSGQVQSAGKWANEWPTIWIAEVVASRLKRRGVGNWCQLLPEVVERWPRRCRNVYTHSIVVGSLSELRVRQFAVRVNDWPPPLS